MASRVAIASISAQETLFLQLGTASTAALALITVSNPSPASERLSGWSFSAVLLPLDAIITDASQPCYSQPNWSNGLTKFNTDDKSLFLNLPGQSNRGRRDGWLQEL